MEIKAAVSIFKNKEYFVMHKINTKNGFKTQISTELNSVENREFDLGIRVLSALNKSEEGLICSTDLDYWEALGYKTFPSFSKKHDLVSVLKIDNFYRITRWKKDRGGYVPDKDRKKIELPLDVTAKEIEYEIKRAFEEEVEEDENLYFETINDSKVEYKNPDYSDFYDKGDGHTDAYQIYEDVENEKNYLGFMIDSGYESFSEKDIRKKFEQYYGELLEYTYKEIEDKSKKLKVEAKTKESEIVSNFFKDGDSLLEVIYKIDLTKPEEKIQKIKRDFEEVISSIKIDNK